MQLLKRYKGSKFKMRTKRAIKLACIEFKKAGVFERQITPIGDFEIGIFVRGKLLALCDIRDVYRERKARGMNF